MDNKVTVEHYKCFYESLKLYNLLKNNTPNLLAYVYLHRSDNPRNNMTTIAAYTEKFHNIDIILDFLEKLGTPYYFYEVAPFDGNQYEAKLEIFNCDFLSLIGLLNILGNNGLKQLLK